MVVVVVLPIAFSFRAAVVVVVGFCFIVRCELCPGDRHTYLVGAKGSHLTPKGHHERFKDIGRSSLLHTGNTSACVGFAGSRISGVVLNAETRTHVRRKPKEGKDSISFSSLAPPTE